MINGVDCYKNKKRSGVSKEHIETYGAGPDNSPPPVCFLAFDEGSGTEAADSSHSANDHDATLVDVTWDASTKAAGSHSVQLGTGDEVELTSHADLQWDHDTEWTVSAYVKIPASDTTYRGIYSNRMGPSPSATAYRGVAIFASSGNPEIYIISKWGNPATPGDDKSIWLKGVVGQATFVNTGNIVHIICTYDGSTSSAGVTLWIDGVKHTVANGKLTVGSSHDTLGSDTVTNSVDPRVGGDTTTTNYNCNNVDHVTLWKGVTLTDEQADT